MSSRPAFALRALRLMLLVLGLGAGVARADLAWDPATGWQIQGGALSGLTGAEGGTALGLMNKARREEDRGSRHAAISDYTKVTKKYGSSIYAPEAFFHIAELRYERHQYFDAFQAYQQIIGRYPSDRRFNEIIARQYRIASLLLDGRRPRFFGWLPGFPNREKAIGYCELILQNAPYSDYAPLALMNEARGFQYLKDIDESIDALDRLVNTYPDSVLVPDTYLRLGDMHAKLVKGPEYDQAETKQALTYYQDFMILFPGDPDIAQAAEGVDAMKNMLAESKIKIGDFYFYKRDNYPAARVFYNQAITAYPDSPVAQLAKKRLASVETKAAAMAKRQLSAAPARHFLFF